MHRCGCSPTPELICCRSALLRYRRSFSSARCCLADQACYEPSEATLLTYWCRDLRVSKHPPGGIMLTVQTPEIPGDQAKLPSEVTTAQPYNIFYLYFLLSQLLPQPPQLSTHPVHTLFLSLSHQNVMIKLYKNTCNTCSLFCVFYVLTVI